MVGLSVAVQRWTQSNIEPLYLLHLVLLVVMDEESHGHHDLTIIVIIVRQCVDDTAEQKLVRTMRHDLRQLEHPMSNYFHIYAPKNGLRALQITLFGARQMAEKVVSARTHAHTRRW
jgi:hypothetical protein